MSRPWTLRNYVRQVETDEGRRPGSADHPAKPMTMVVLAAAADGPRRRGGVGARVRVSRNGPEFAKSPPRTRGAATRHDGWPTRDRATRLGIHRQAPSTTPLK